MNTAFQIRCCFHPGATNLAREGLKFTQKAKKVTGKDMIKALSNYIWPKGQPGAAYTKPEPVFQTEKFTSRHNSS
jgi:hypothetical protein